MARPRPRLSLAVAAARAAAATSGMLGHGATSLPGLVSLRIEPRCVRFLASQLGDGTVVVAGTNGKTTTTMLVASALRAAGKRVVHNRAGSNMIRGIASTLVRESALSGSVRHAARLTGLFEVDEAALPRVLAEVGPRVVTLTNLFRDQLDRYGELATIAERWREALAKLPDTTTVVLNADDPLVASLGDAARGRVVYFGVEEWLGGHDMGTVPALSADTLFCPRCSAPLVFDYLSYAHLGHYRCSACDFARPRPDIAVEARQRGAESSELRFCRDGEDATCALALPGRYNVYNAAAAVATAVCAGVALSAAVQAMSVPRRAFGRAETIEVDGHAVRLFLIKNPTGADEVFQVAAEGDREHPMLLLLSDNAADGEDVSWIWDARLELLVPWRGPVLCGGTRAEDMALRMKYAGQSGEPETIPGNIPAAVERAIQAAPTGKPVTILATYTAMLAARHALARCGHVVQYWRDSA